MTQKLTIDEILNVMSAASVGDVEARVILPDAPLSNDVMTKFGMAVNHLLDDLNLRSEAVEVSERLVIERTKQLRVSEEKFAKAFRASPAAMSLATLPDGRWIEINEELARMTGYSSEELLGHTSSELGLVDPEARAKLLQAIAEQGRIHNVEIQMKTKTNEQIDVLVSVEQIEINGQMCALTIQYDITELKRAEREVRRLNRDLEQRQKALEVVNAELESFSYSVAHDLRTPLRSIDGFSQAVLEDYMDKLDEDGQKYLQSIRRSAQQMARLIDDLLMLSKVTRSEIHLETVNLSAIARSLLAHFQKNDPERRVEVVIPPELIIEADGRLMTIVLENLLGNAWKFTSKCPEARIELGLEEKEGKTVYFVRDNGAGFDMTYAHKLFGAFQRLHSAKEFDGTGIGLAIVRRIILRHGGQVWAEGEVDKGATLYFTLNEIRP